MKKLLILSCIGFCAFSCAVQKDQAPLITYRIKAVFPHDITAFTQGLVIHQGKVFESTGKNPSWIAEVNLQTGEQVKKIHLSKHYFGEGITILNNKLYQLTWKNKKGFIYQLNTFEKTAQFSYAFQGWGITTDKQYLIISDGTNRLYYLDTLQTKVVKTISVKHHQKKIKNLNELEYYKGYILANQWKKPFIWKIDPESGKAVGKLDLSCMVAEINKNYPKANVLNGIAYNAHTDEILITGKYWPYAYLLQLD